MGSCTRRHFLLSTCFLQMITIIERQVFDFLGYMWLPIIANFLHILFIIFGFYGAYHFRIKYIVTYLIWNFVWIGWNAFLICFYMNVGELDRDSDLLNVGTGSVSWFEVNGYGCKPTYSQNLTIEDPYRPIRPERVDDCLLDYTLVEVIHAGVQAALALLGVLGAILISYIFLDEDDRFDFMNGDAKSPQHTVVHPMYVSYTSIPTSASATMLSNKHNNNHHQQQQQQQQQQQLQQQQLSQQLSQQQSLSLSQTQTQTNQIHNHHHQQQQQQKHQQQQQLHTNSQYRHNHVNKNPNNNNNNHYSSNSNFNNNTFLIHSNNSTSNNQKKRNSNSSIFSNNSHTTTTTQHNHTPNASKPNTLTKIPYSPKSNRIASTASTILPTASQSPQMTPTTPAAHGQRPYYDDSTAKADQLYTNSNRRHQMQMHQLPAAQTPGSSHENTTSSLSYASLQNSNLNLKLGAHFLGGGGVMDQGVSDGGAPGSGPGGSSLSNSQYSLTNSNVNNNNNNTSIQQFGGGGGGTNNSGRFARIHSKPRPPKSPSYSSFINSPNSAASGNTVSVAGSGGNLHRPDIKYSRMSSERLSSNLEDGFDDDNFTLATNGAITYVPFNKPTPGKLYVGQNNNPSYASLNSITSATNANTRSPNNNSANGAMQFVRDNSQVFLNNDNEILLERGAILQPSPRASLTNRPYQGAHHNNGLPQHAAYSPTPYRSNPHAPYRAGAAPTRPTNIPLPTVPVHMFDMTISPSQVTPPPPPAPRPHIFQPRSGHAPYPDLSPEVTERYAMPTQYIPRSPVASRIARRQRQQQHERSHLANPSVNFCDQIRNAPPGYIDNGYNIVRAHSHDRLMATPRSERTNAEGAAKAVAAATSVAAKDTTAAPHVNRRSGRRVEGKARPRSYCNSITGGDGVIRGSIVLDGGAPIGRPHDTNWDYQT